MNPPSKQLVCDCSVIIPPPLTILPQNRKGGGIITLLSKINSFDVMSEFLKQGNLQKPNDIF